MGSAGPAGIEAKLISKSGWITYTIHSWMWCSCYIVFWN